MLHALRTYFIRLPRPCQCLRCRVGLAALLLLLALPMLPKEASAQDKYLPEPGTEARLETPPLGPNWLAQAEPPQLEIANEITGETVSDVSGRDTIYIGAYFVWVYDLDLTGGSYSTKAWLWFRYKNDTLKPLEYVAVFNAKEYSFSHPISKRVGEWNWVRVNCNALVRQKWDLKHFPFDKQVLRFRVGYAGRDQSNMVILPDTNSVYDPYNHVEGWDMEGFEVLVEPRTYDSDFGPPVLEDNSTTIDMFMARMKLQRRGGILFWKLFTGMYAAFLISWLSLFINPQAVDPRFGLSVGGLFASVGNKYIVDNIMPQSVSNSLVDSLHELTFMSVILCIAISVISLYFAARGETRLYKRIDRFSAIGMLVGFALLNAIMIYNAVFAAPPKFW